jgi:hypothetical protein
VADDNFAATQVPGGVLHYADSERQVGVAGAAVAQTWDLTVFPEEIRKDPSFRDQLLATFQAVDTGVTAVASPSILPAAPALPEQLQVLITAVATTDRVNLSLVLPHSVVR